MIRKLAIRNFKSLRDVSVDLERLTLIVGPNASGKTSILQALQLLCDAFAEDNGFAVAKQILASLSHGTENPVDIGIETTEQAFRCVVARENDLNPRQSERGVFQQTGLGRGTASSLNSSEWEDYRRIPPKPPCSILLRLESSRPVDVQWGNGQDPSTMAPDGSGLHSALAAMALNDPDSWLALQDHLRQIIPTIRRLRHSRPSGNQPSHLLFDTIGGDSLPGSQVSEGTLLILGMLASLYSPSRPNLVLLDDLDRGLHPKAQRDWIALLRGLMKEQQDLQIIATTHSPYMLDSVAPEEVRMTVLRDDGSTACAPLTDHPKFEKWKDEMTPGEMWSLFGEKWLIEQQEAAS
jgi:predicted ATPase